MKSSLFLVVAFLGFASFSQAATYNTCTKEGDPKSGLFFENGYSQPSPNASEHYAEKIVWSVDGERQAEYKITGDGLYGADCEPLQGDPGEVELNLSKTSYTKFNRWFRCAEGETLKVQFDLSITDAPNGTVSRRLPGGKTDTFAVNCGAN